MKSKKHMDEFGNIKWYNEIGQLHREDDPAVEYIYGYKEWFINSKRHRLDGPAIEFPNGDKEWWINNIRHREDGPAVERVNGYKEWWINNKQLTEESFNKRILKKKLQELL